MSTSPSTVTTTTITTPITSTSSSSKAPTTDSSTMTTTSASTQPPATSTSTVINTSTTSPTTSASPTVSTSTSGASTETSAKSTSTVSTTQGTTSSSSTTEPSTSSSTTMSPSSSTIATMTSTTPTITSSTSSLAPTTSSSTMSTTSASTQPPVTSTSTVINTSSTQPGTSASPTVTTSITSTETSARSTSTVSSPQETTSSTSSTDLIFRYGNRTQDLTLRNVDDACSPDVTSSLQFPIFGILYTQIYICSNGIVSFSKIVTTPNPPGSDNELRQYSFLAPYFTDLDLRQTGSYVEATIHYHAYDVIRNYSLIKDNNVALARDFVRRTERDQEHFSPTFLLVVTWEKVLPYPAKSRQSEAVSFQLALVTDGLNTFAFYIYFKNQMQLKSNDVFIGYAFHVPGIVKKDLNSFTNSALTIDSNVETNGQTGLLYYRLTPSGYQFSNDERICLSWWSENRGKKNYYEKMNDEMPSCPCSMNWLWWDGTFGNDYFQDSNTYCSVIRPRWSYSPHGKTCCYDWRTRQYLQSSPRAGGFQEYHKITYTKQYKTEDERMKDFCCYRTNLCYLYYELRPVSQCYSVFPFFFAVFWGDPHIETLDKKKFTFNGWGEYTLVSVETDNVTFLLQSRTSRAVRMNGSLADATIFSAFAAMDNLGTNVHVELNRSNDGLIIYAKSNINSSTFDDYTSDFADLLKEFNIQDEYVSLSRDNSTMTLTVVFSSGISFNVSLGVKMLSVGVVLPTEFRNKTKGLLGNFDGDPDNDFMFPNGTILTAKTSDRDLFKYGQSWEVDGRNAIFRYPIGKNHSDFHHRDFIPKFLDEANISKVEAAKEKCGNENQECIFDLVFTENEAVANNTKSVEQRASSSQRQLENDVPTITGNATIYAEIGRMVTVRVNGSDDGSFEYHIVTNITNATIQRQNDSTGVISFLLNSTSPVTLSVVAQDEYGINSPSLDLAIRLCTGCSGHGTCNITQEDTGIQASTTFSNFKIAICNCSPFWEGINCENDFNGCASTPCSPLRTCMDNPAAVHKALSQAYNCSSCPQGYTNGVIDPTKCEDVNECHAISHGCNQTCINTEGSYHCRCESTFRLHLNGKDCEDINECDEGISGCDQMCSNTYGGFNCTCHNGYIRNMAINACELVKNISVCQNKDCSKAYGCTEDNEGNATCFCQAGYELTGTNTCKDINECDQNICSQKCENKIGTFECKCLRGYTLRSDKTTCNLCSYPFYGDNCSNICNCGRGAGKCDPIKGCVCDPGWTGSRCDQDINECENNPNICDHILTDCMNTVGSFSCKCRQGYTAINDTCKDINECIDPTLNKCEQTCKNTMGGYTCSCNSGYKINSRNDTQCQDIDECTTGNSGCEHICENSPGRFSCSCYFGYELTMDRKACQQVEDPCRKYGNLTCNQICIVDLQKETAACSCNQGFIIGADHQSCFDINECTEKNGSLNMCSVKNSCENTYGSYKCLCDAGFKLENDGRTCKECDSFHYGINCTHECICGAGADRCDSVIGCVCKNGWTGDKCDLDQNECSIIGVCTGTNSYCLNIPGSYQCLCSNGYKKDESGLCKDVDECSDSSLNTCEQICTNTNGSYLCSCSPGFLQEANRCTDIDECMNVHNCSQICTNTVGNYRCTCNEGFRLNDTDRRSCYPSSQCSLTEIKECKEKKALCFSRNGSGECYCPKGYENLTGICEDINECNRTQPKLPCTDNCTNTNGSYKCSCIAGKELGADGSTCVDCPAGKYGNNCEKQCLCNNTNTETCDAVSGLCTCKHGWNGTNCNEDVKECRNDVVNCTENSTCRELPGSFICLCNAGFTKTSDGICAPCPANRHGDNCKENCTCIPANTLTCDPINGTCICKDGWLGQNCSQDVDECTSSFGLCKGSNQYCSNTPGSYRCICSPGTRLNANNSCIDIDECIESVDFCEHICVNVDGNYTCECNSGYTRDRFKCTDINECFAERHNCTQACRNTNGSFVCSCFGGYEGNGYTCKPLPGRYSVQVTFIFNINMSNENLSDYNTYSNYTSAVNTTLSNYSLQSLGEDFVGIEILRISIGSLKVECRLITQDSVTAKSSLVKYMLEAYSESFYINNKRAPLLAIESNGQTISKSQDQCETNAILNQPCQPDYECSVQANGPVCRPKPKDNFNLVVGLGVGIPLGILLVLLIIVLIIYFRRGVKKQSLSDGSSLDERSRASAHGFVPPGMMPTKMSSQVRSGPFFAPYQWDSDSEMSFGSFHRELTSTEPQSYQSVFDTTHQARMHGAADDYERQHQPSNFSWDFMFEYMNPNEMYEIRRPHTDPVPNPLYQADA